MNDLWRRHKQLASQPILAHIHTYTTYIPIYKYYSILGANFSHTKIQLLNPPNAINDTQPINIFKSRIKLFRSIGLDQNKSYILIHKFELMIHANVNLQVNPTTQIYKMKQTSHNLPYLHSIISYSLVSLQKENGLSK